MFNNTPENFDQTNPGSPFFKGVECTSCGETTFNPDEDNRCPSCHLVKCKSCETKVPQSTLKSWAGRMICTGCYEYEFEPTLA